MPGRPTATRETSAHPAAKPPQPLPLPLPLLLAILVSGILPEPSSDETADASSCGEPFGEALGEAFGEPCILAVPDPLRDGCLCGGSACTSAASDGFRFFSADGKTFGDAGAAGGDGLWLLGTLLLRSGDARPSATVSLMQTRRPRGESAGGSDAGDAEEGRGTLRASSVSGDLGMPILLRSNERPM